MRTRRGRGRGARADCGEHLVFERRPDDGSFIPDSHLFVLKYLNWGGGGGAGKKGMHAICGKCVLTYAAILCGWRCRAVGIVLKKKSCCGVAILVRWRMYVYIYSCWCGVDILVRWEMYVYMYSSWCACAGVALVDTLCVPDLGIRNGNQNLPVTNQRGYSVPDFFISTTSAIV